MQQQSYNTTAALRAYRPPKRSNLKRVADSSASNTTNAQKRQRTRAYIPKYKSANALPQTWTIRQFRTFQRLRTAGPTCPTCTQILPKPTPELVTLALHGSRGASPSASPSTSTGATKSTGSSTHLTGTRTKTTSSQTSGAGQGFLNLRPSEYALHQGSSATLSRSSTDVIFTSNHSHLPLTQEATATSSLGYYVARRVAKGLVPHPSLPYNMANQTLYVEMPRSTCAPNEPAYITYMTSATQINMMRMVLVPAPVIYPNIPIAPVEPLLPAHPLPVAQTQSLNTDVHEPSPQIIDLASSTHSVTHCPATPTNSPVTTPAQPDKKLSLIHI